MILHETTHPLAISKHLLTPPPKPLPPPPPERGLLVGYRPDGKEIRVPYEEFEGTHIEMAGSSGTGKSFLLHSMLCQWAKEGRGYTLIEPHGELFKQQVNWCAQHLPPERTVLIDAARASTLLNPITEDDWSLTAGCLYRLGGHRAVEHTARLGRLVPQILRVMATSRLSLSQMPRFCRITPDGARCREEALSHVRDPELIDEWLQFETLGRTRQLDMIDSTVNRVLQLFHDERMKTMFGSWEGNLSWDEIFDQQKVVLVHLGPGQPELDERSRQLVGLVCMEGLRRAAFRRPFNAAPYLVACDEFARYCTDDYADMLDQLRKLHVHFILSHQRLAQIEREAPDVLSAIFANCGVKLLFSMRGRVDAERMSQEIFTGEIHGEEIKYDQTSIGFRPKQEWVTIRSVSHGTTSGYGEGSAHVVGHGDSGGKSFLPPDIPLITDGHTFSHSEGTSDHTADSSTSFWSTAESHSESESVVPITVFEEFLQEPSRQFVSLEEQRERRVAMLMNLPHRTVALKRPNKPVELLYTPEVNDPKLPPHQLEAYAQASWHACPYSVPASTPHVTSDVSSPSVEPPAAPRSVEKEDNPRADGQARHPEGAPPQTAGQQMKASLPTADRSPSAPPLGKRPRGRPRKHPIPDAPRLPESVETPSSGDLAPASDSDLL